MAKAEHFEGWVSWCSVLLAEEVREELEPRRILMRVGYRRAGQCSQRDAVDVMLVSIRPSLGLSASFCELCRQAVPPAIWR